MSSNTTHTTLGSSVILDPVIAGIPRLMSADETMRVIGVGRSKFFQMLKTGEAPPHVVIGGKRLFAVDDVSAWIDMRKRQSAA
jgi:predicted DNA-binding transcriptional regulator AlpA